MKPRLFLTGASGCVGHYLVDTLAPRYDLHILVRDTSRLMFDPTALGARVVPGDLSDIGEHADLLSTMDYAVLAATAWGAEGTERINVDCTHQLLGFLEPSRLKRIVYFSTASILGSDMRPLPEAETYGTTYVLSKYRCYQSLVSHPLRERLVAVFPTLVLGGDANHPLSHVSSGLPAFKRYSRFLGHVNVDVRFHFVHAADIAAMVQWILDAPTPQADYVLGNEPISLGAFMAQAARAVGHRMSWQVPVTAAGLYRLARLVGAQMSKWDAFQVRHGDLVYPATSCATLGLPSTHRTVSEVMADLPQIQAVLASGRSR